MLLYTINIDFIDDLFSLTGEESLYAFGRMGGCPARLVSAVVTFEEQVRQRNKVIKEIESAFQDAGFIGSTENDPNNQNRRYLRLEQPLTGMDKFADGLSLLTRWSKLKDVFCMSDQQQRIEALLKAFPFLPSSNTCSYELNFNGVTYGFKNGSVTKEVDGTAETVLPPSGRSDIKALTLST